MKNSSTGQYRGERINEDCWDDEVFRRGCELIWTEAGFALIEDLPQGSREGAGLVAVGLGIDDNSGKIVDFETRYYR